LIATPPPQIEQARMRAALRIVEEKMAAASTSLVDEARRRLRAASLHLEKAVALWRRALEQRAQGMSWRKTQRRSRLHVRRSRKHWKLAVRMLKTA
jgi:hypothetical protein